MFIILGFNAKLINLGFDPRRPVLQDVVSWRKRAGNLGLGERIDKLGKAQPPTKWGEWPSGGPLQGVSGTSPRVM